MYCQVVINYLGPCLCRSYVSSKADSSGSWVRTRKAPGCGDEHVAETNASSIRSHKEGKKGENTLVWGREGGDAFFHNCIWYLLDDTTMTLAVKTTHLRRVFTSCWTQPKVDQFRVSLATTVAFSTNIGIGVTSNVGGWRMRSTCSYKATQEGSLLVGTIL